MKPKLHILISACLVLIGCMNTEGTLEIRGKVLDESTKKDIPNRKVIIQGLVYDDSKIITSNAGEFFTDSTGHFSYTMHKTKGAYSYNFCFVGDSAYSISTQEVFLGELEKNSKYLSFYLSKLTDFTIKIERCSKTPLYDTLYVSWETDGVERSTIYPHKVINYGNALDFEFRWIGGKVKSVIETKALANKQTIICWELFRNGRKKEILDTIFCERDANNYFNFKY
jgi:hypothetical protein